jgi:mRNA-degrading endonuclease RelE of RelBE toxin-antitoxin system
MSPDASGGAKGRPAYRVDIKKSADKAIDKLKLSDEDQDALDDAIMALAQDPRPANSEQLTGYPLLRKLKLPPYRIIYTVNDEERWVLILHAERRTEHTYKHLDRLMSGLTPKKPGSKQPQRRQPPKDKR